jgi:pimeloyl-ACP methyl ester carboxylesterase
MNPLLAPWRNAGSWFSFAGHRIFYRRAGSGPPLLLIHGYPTGSWDWHRVWEALVERHDVIAPDMLGLGFSDKPRDHRYGVFDHADMHAALLRELGLGRVRVIAHDLGVSVAQELLARQLDGGAPCELASVVFLNGGLFAECYRPRLIQRVLGTPLGGLIGPRIPRAAFERTIRELFGSGSQPGAEVLDAMWALVNEGDGRRVTHLVGRFVFDRVAHRDRLVRPLVAGRVPLRLVNGSRDPNSGAHMARRYRELVPGADVVDLPEIGHWPQIEAPAAVLAAIRDFHAQR